MAGIVVTAQLPNVIIVMTDDQGYPELSVHGNPLANAQPRPNPRTKPAVGRLSIFRPRVRRRVSNC